MIVWVDTSPEVCHQRMVERNSSRDTWKLQNWDKYIAGCNFNKPEGIGDILVFHNNSMEEFNQSIKDMQQKFSKY